MKQQTSASAKAENGVSAGGLMTTVHPAASAGPNLRVIIAEGKFHGVIIALPRIVSLDSDPEAKSRLVEEENIHDTDRLFDNYISGVGDCAWNVVSVCADGFFGLVHDVRLIHCF